MSEPLKNNRVVKRFKKDRDSFTKLEKYIDKFEEDDFKSSLKNFISSERFVPLRYTFENLLEIRLRDPNWRILAYLCVEHEMIVMIDAKVVHERNTVSEITKLANLRKTEIEAIEKEIEKRTK